MATLAENDENRPLITPARTNSIEDLDSMSIEPSWTYSIIESPMQAVKGKDDGKLPMFLIAGPRLKFFRLIQLYSFFLVIFMYQNYLKNGSTLLTRMAEEVFNMNEESGPGPFVVYLMPVFVSSLPMLLSVFFGFISDYMRYQRVYLIGYSCILSSLSAFLLMICGYLIASPSAETFLPTIGFPVTQTFVILSIVFYILGVSIFLPISLAYGLDLLNGTKWEVLYLYFPVFYVVNNLAFFTDYMDYIYLPDGYLKESCIAAFFVVIGTWLLFIIFRLFGIFPTFDTELFDLISFRKGCEIFMHAFRKRQSGEKSPRGHWFIQLASEAYSGKYPRIQVQMVASFFEINFLLFLLLLLFISTQIMSTLFPQQGLLLNWPYSKDENEFCTDSKTKDSPPTIKSLVFVNWITIVLLTPILECYFYKIVFFFNSAENLKLQGGKSFFKRILKCFRCFDRYWIPYDPMLKRIFWGSIFGLVSMILAFSVEIGRLNSGHFNITCHNNITSKPSLYIFSNFTVFSQVPQYVASGILEICSFIGCLHFVYFQSANTYKDSLKGLFFGLFYFYIGIGSTLSLLVYYFMTVMCATVDGGCDYCLSYVSKCSNSRFQFAWIPWAFLMVEFILLVVFFAWFTHYRHWKIANIKNRRYFLDAFAINGTDEG